MAKDTGSKKRQPGNPPVRTPRIRQGAMTRQIKAMVKRANRKPSTPKGR